MSESRVSFVRAKSPFSFILGRRKAISYPLSLAINDDKTCMDMDVSMEKEARPLPSRAESETQKEATVLGESGR